MVSSLVVIFVSAIAALWIGRHHYLKYLLLLPILLAFWNFFTLWISLGGLPLVEAPLGQEENAFGFRLSLLGDGLSLVLAQLICGVGALVLLYSLSYFHRRQDTARFTSYLLFFMGAMLGVVLSNNLLLLFVFWELTSVSSYFLIAFNHEEEKSRKSALQAFLVTGVGGLCLLAGFIVLGSVVGTFELDRLIEGSSLFSTNPKYTLVTILILIGALTKSAQFPFHFWLPNAMTAPSPASSYLHSATMVKAGIFLLLRLNPLLGNTSLWHQSLLLTGGLTIALASIMALINFDLKKVLAYTTLAALGILTVLLGVDSNLSLSACLLFLVAHALYKAPLFLIVGSIDHEFGTRDWRPLGNLKQSMPITFYTVLLCSFAMASLPPFFSFLAKESVIEALQGFPIILILMLSSSVVFTYLACLLLFHVFLGTHVSPLQNSLPKMHEAPVGMMMAPLLMAIFAFGLSVWPNTILLSIRDSVFAVIRPEAEALSYFSYWHGINIPLLLSLLALALGVGLYFLLPKLKIYLENWGAKTFFGPSAIYEWLLKNLAPTSKRFFNLIQNGNLNVYLITISVFVLFILKKAMHGSQIQLTWNFNNINLFEVTMGLAISAGALLAIKSRHAVAALTALGLVGFGIAFLYLINGAPDLALTQFLVETLTLVLLVLCFRVLPTHRESNTAPSYAMIVAIFAGILGFALSFITLAAGQSPVKSAIRDYFGNFSHTLANGRNVVNVILVDFRGIDTMGEITVLCIAAVGVFTLLTWKSRAENNHNE